MPETRTLEAEMNENEIKADAKVDMTYSFLWDSEPTDEQLQVIMEEVAEEARRGREKVARQVIENIEREYARAFALQQIQQT